MKKREKAVNLVPQKCHEGGPQWTQRKNTFASSQTCTAGESYEEALESCVLQETLPSHLPPNSTALTPVRTRLLVPFTILGNPHSPRTAHFPRFPPCPHLIPAPASIPEPGCSAGRQPAAKSFQPDTLSTALTFRLSEQSPSAEGAASLQSLLVLLLSHCPLTSLVPFLPTWSLSWSYAFSHMSSLWNVTTLPFYR